jgi:CheY-like chemotaxis protein
MSLDGRKEQLVEIARSQARMMESVGKFDAFFSGGAEGASLAATLSQVKEANRAHRGSRRTREWRAYLGDYDLELLEATNGQEAVEQTRRYHPDLVVMDMRMPVMNGYEATGILKQDPVTAAIPVLALTASVMSHHEEQVREICDGYLRKPATKAQLVNEVARFLNHTRPDTSAATPMAATSEAAAATDGAGSAPPEVVRALESEQEAWRALVETLTITDIEEFAQRLQAVAGEHGWDPLAEWAARLEGQASSFDLGSLPTTLGEYERLLAAARGEAV